MGVTAGEPTQRVGVFGGTFDPPHAGHVEIARYVLSAGLVDSVLVIPTGQPWLRPSDPGASAEQRLEMARLAFAECRGIEVLDLEVRRDGPSYTVDTLRELSAMADGRQRHVLILGTDAARTITKWHDHERMLGMCELLIVGRPGEGGLEDLPGEHPARRAAYVEGPQVDASATEIRRRLGIGEDVSGMVPAAVADYVREHGLYGPGTGPNREAG